MIEAADKGKKSVIKNESQISGWSSQADKGVTYEEKRDLWLRGGKSGFEAGGRLWFSRLSCASDLVLIPEATFQVYFTKIGNKPKRQTNNKQNK